jgi:hypothetical protein
MQLCFDNSSAFAAAEVDEIGRRPNDDALVLCADTHSNHVVSYCPPN